MAQSSAIPALLTLVALITTTAAAQPQPHPANLPPDVAAFVGRRASCQKAADRRPAGAEGTAQVANVLRSLDCGDVPRDEQALRGKYANDPNTLAALDATWVKVVQRVPDRVPVKVAPEADPPDPPDTRQLILKKLRQIMIKLTTW
jgi:hypothetical protein